MTKWCIDWEAVQFFIELYKKKEEEWEKSYLPKKYFDSHGLEHALRVLFEHKGFWVEEESE